MAQKISQKELQYIKKSISEEQLMDLIALKASLNKRKAKLGQSVNESESFLNESEQINPGFQMFYSNLDEKHKNMFNEVFGIFQNENSGTSLQGKVYALFQKFLSVADKYLADSAN